MYLQSQPFAKRQSPPKQLFKCLFVSRLEAGGIDIKKIACQNQN